MNKNKILFHAALAVFALLLTVIIQYSISLPDAKTVFAFNNHPALLAQTEEDIRQSPTSDKNAQIRFHRLNMLLRLVLAETGEDEINKIIPPQLHKEIANLLEERKFDIASPKIDEAILGLCKIGKVSPFLTDIIRASFKTKSGATIAGYLIPPKRPSKTAFIFGHGGFGFKENWVDVMSAVAKESNTFALTIDFEGVGESTGYSSWKGRKENFSAAIDYLKKEFGITQFAVGGHSGGGAYPAATASIDDPRISALILWDCPFDFYDMHITQNALDPGGNPACLLDRTQRTAKKRYLVPTEVADFRKIDKRIDLIYQEIEQTLRKYRHPAKMLGEIQKKRKVAVLHIIAEDVINPIGDRPNGETFFLPPTKASQERSRFSNRPLSFFASGLFDRPKDMWRRWHNDLNEPKKVTIIPKITHAFEQPGRQVAIKETIDWINKYLKP